MMTKPDGGLAFPLIERGPNGETSVSLGMSLRDYFAAKAMQGFLAGHIAHHGHDNHWRYPGMAGDAYAVADAMLKAREE